jgi:RNA polymerase sigma factor (TIGR02999 family)
MSQAMPMVTAPENVTAVLLRAWAAGDRQAGERLMPLVYGELHRQAARCLRRERRDHLLSTTGLVHEAYLRLAGGDVRWTGRGHFLGVAARVMRQVLVDHARRHRAAKRGGGWTRVSLDDAEPATAAGERDLDLVVLQRGLEELAALDAGKARVVELRFFGGLSLEEIAETLGVSPSTITREWRLARAWLRRWMVAQGAEARPAGAAGPSPPARRAAPWWCGTGRHRPGNRPGAIARHTSTSAEPPWEPFLPANAQITGKARHGRMRTKR